MPQKAATFTPDQRRCNGEATLETIVASLAAEYDAPRDIIKHDVMAVLVLLSEKGFLEFSPTEKGD